MFDARLLSNPVSMSGQENCRRIADDCACINESRFLNVSALYYSLRGAISKYSSPAK